MDETESLRTVPFFADLSPEDLRAIVEVGSRVTFPPGTAIVGQGDAGDAMYVMLEGTAEVDIGGRYHVLHPGSIFGEMALLSARKRIATVKAVEPVEALRIPADEFRGFLLEHPSVAVAMLKAMADRLREVQTRIDAWIGS
jgi:CRP-like cAMP-binding protein